MAESDFLDAKAFLLKASSATGISVYDHLTNVISRLLDERPNNAVDIIEDLSSQVKHEQFKPVADTIQVCPACQHPRRRFWMLTRPDM